MSDEGMNLTENEAKCLAYRIASTHLADTESWLEWENYPMLGQYAFERLDEEVRTIVVGYLRDALGLMERTWNIDSADLLERAT